ncbi:MAG: AAA family ATPase [Lentisphaeraceae bacterium]|nr:AAA family ATPase [Lentisphaeraceae bacterium]
MRLKKLIIPDHKGFINFETTFAEESTVTTVIGQNGVGKSNLIEIIVSIFRSIDLGESLEFCYSLLYECRGHQVQICYNHQNAKATSVFIDETKRSLSYLKKNANEYLPLTVFTYYSGTNWRVEKLFLKHQTHFYKALTEGDDKLIRRFFYCRDEHSFFVLLAFLVDDDPACKEIIKKLDIASLDSVLFRLKKPYWFKSKPSKIMQDEGDPRIWYSRGVVKDFLGKLWEQAIAPIDNKERKIIDFRGRIESQERLYLFLPDEESLKDLADNYPDTTSLFKNLESTYIADLLEQVDVSVTLTNGHKLTFDQLSEGERQLLTVLGLMKFTRDDESLFLLDEPDTHLNPRWKLDYFDQIKRILDHDIEGSDKTSWESSQVILTTHDPLMLTSLRREQVRVLTEDKDGKRSDLPEVDPMTMGVEGIIQSELYGIRTSLDQEIQNKIDLRSRLLAENKLDGKPLDKLIELNEELDQMGLAHAHPNPYFSNFAKAISRNQLFRRPDFTPEEYDEIQDLSDELLAELLEEERAHDQN